MRVLLITNEVLKKELLAGYTLNDELLEIIERPDVPDQTETLDACVDLLFQHDQGRIDSLKRLPVSLIVVNAVIPTVNDLKADFVRINGWPTFLERTVTEAATTNDSLRLKTEQVFSALGKRVEWVPDVTGLITPRVVASIVNEAFYALEEKVSTVEDIDTAMKLGTNYPYGPFDWAKKIGLKNVCDLLTTLSRSKDRYTPAALLKKTASI